MTAKKKIRNKFAAQGYGPDKVVFESLNVTIMKTYTFIFLNLILLVVSSCTENKKQMMSLDLVETVSELQVKLPLSFGDLGSLTNVEYKDTIFTMELTIDERECSFENFVKMKNNRKNFILTHISASRQTGRKLFEQCASYNVYLRYLLKGKYSNKELEIIVTPEEIKQALNKKCSAYQVLKIQIEGENSTLPEKIDDGAVITNIDLIDTMVYVTVKYDEDIFQLTGIEDKLENTGKILASDPLTANFLKTISDARCGLVYRYVGSVSGKTYDIVFTSKELLILMTDYETKVKTQF